ncbi:hypothetical protein I4U23_004255 [Adineta vaga]|nr:hypothetical protein I4U23_004255 [Adineta vaga]
MNTQSNIGEIEMVSMEDNIFSIDLSLSATNKSIDENKDDTEDFGTSPENKITTKTKNRYCSILNSTVKGVFAFCIFSSIAMLTGILIVCYTIPKPSGIVFK